MADPIITKRRKGNSEDAFVPLSESHIIENGTVILSEIPSKFNRVTVTGESITWIEKDSGSPTENQYVVDYNNNIITFHVSRNGLQLQFDYMGTGMHYVPATMIYTQTNQGEVVETLSNIITNGQLAIDTLATVEQITTDANSATTVANNAANLANDKATLAQTKADLADSKAILANDAAVNANNVANNLDFIGDYNSATTYQPHNIVRYQNAIYMCKVACTGVVPTNTINWKLLTSDGLNLQYIGEYSNITTYYVDNVTTWNGDSYVCIATTTGNLPTDETKWRIFHKSHSKLVTFENSVTLVSDLSSVNIGIPEYNSTTDYLLVHKNSTHVFENDEYTISGSTIVKMGEGVWTVDPPTTFHFIVFKNVTDTNINYPDGSLIQTGSIGNAQLADDIKIGSLPDLTTIEKGSLVGAVNEHNEQIGILSGIVINVKAYGAKGDGTTDDTASIQSAIDYAYTISGTVYLPVGTYIVSTIELRKDVSFVGCGGRFCKIKKKAGTTGNIIQYKQENTSYSFNIRIGGFAIEGTGIGASVSPLTNASPDLTNNGLVINPYWGLDGVRLFDLLIKDCGGTGLQIIPSPNNEAQSELMVLQQSQIDNVTVQYCTAGAYIKGFVGNVQWNTCTFDQCTNNAFEIAIGTNGNGGQDNTFINCSFQFSKKGFYAGSNFINANFYGCHFEENTDYGVHFNITANCGEVTFHGCFFARNPIHIWFEAFGGKCSIDNITWKPMTSPLSTDRYVKLGNITGLIFFGFTQSLIATITTMIEDPNFRTRGWNNFDLPTFFAMDHLRVYNGISSTTTRSRNLDKRVVVSANATTHTVTFDVAEADATYNIWLTAEFDSYCWVTNKTTTGFTINIKTPLAVSMGVVWMLLR